MRGYRVRHYQNCSWISSPGSSNLEWNQRPPTPCPPLHPLRDRLQPLLPVTLRRPVLVSLDPTLQFPTGSTHTLCLFCTPVLTCHTFNQFQCWLRFVYLKHNHCCRVPGGPQVKYQHFKFHRPR